jgi:hypothetical protein
MDEPGLLGQVVLVAGVGAGARLVAPLDAVCGVSGPVPSVLAHSDGLVFASGCVLLLRYSS